jgi:hypothetical protein
MERAALYALRSNSCSASRTRTSGLSQSAWGKEAGASLRDLPACKIVTLTFLVALHTAI